MQTTDRLDYENLIRAVQAQLDEASFRKAWTDGRAMKLEQAVEYALQPASASDASIQMPRLYPAGLTEREVEVLRLIAQGLTDAQVGEKLVISTRTVNSHLRSIYSKIGVTTRTSAARFAMDNKLT
jgi:DNA-binding NarL/FixJ family response regulator